MRRDDACFPPSVFLCLLKKIHQSNHLSVVVRLQLAFRASPELRTSCLKLWPERNLEEWEVILFQTELSREKTMNKDIKSFLSSLGRNKSLVNSSKQWSTALLSCLQEENDGNIMLAVNALEREGVKINSITGKFDEVEGDLRRLDVADLWTESLQLLHGKELLPSEKGVEDEGQEEKESLLFLQDALIGVLRVAVRSLLLRYSLTPIAVSVDISPG